MSEASPQVKVPRRRRRLVRLLVAALLLAALIAVGALCLLAALLSREPLVPLQEPADPVALAAAYRKVCAAARAGLLAADAPAHGSPAPAAPADPQPLLLELDQAEVNALLHAGLSMRQGLAMAQTGNADERLACRLDHGEFILRHSRKLPDNPLGHWLNLTASFVPRIEDGRLSLTLTGCRLGRLPIPSWLLQRRLSGQNLPAFAQSPAGRQLLRLVDRLDVRQDGIAIHFHPQAMIDALAQATGMDGDSLFDLFGAGDWWL